MVVKGQIQIDCWLDVGDATAGHGSKDKGELETASGKEVGCR